MTVEESIQRPREELAKEYLEEYRLCADMLQLRRYEKERTSRAEEVQRMLPGGNETHWKLKMYEAEHLISALRDSREKLVLYYRYILGRSVEQTADLLGVSRRTGYRLHRRGLTLFGCILERHLREKAAK